MKYILVGLLFISTISLFGQGMSEDGLQLFEWMDKKKIEFQQSANDSLFISKFGDSPYRKIFLRRGDQPEDVEEAIYHAKPNTVVGPFNAGTHNYLFKVLSLDSMRGRWNVGHIFIKPKGFNAADTAAAYSTALKLAKDLNKGAEFAQVLTSSGDDFKKYAEKVKLGKNPGTEGASGWIWEGTTIPQFDKVLLKARKGEAVVAISPVGVHIFQVTDKQTGHYKAVIIALVKKVKK